MIFDQVIISFNSILAFIFGAIVGYTRIRSNRPAGIRTQALICSGASLITGLSITLGPNYGASNSDPTRLMAQIVTGIGFLGGGVIIKNHDRLKGITTASMIWFTAGIGMLLGSSYYLPAIVALVLIILVELIAKLEFRFGLKTKPYLLIIYKDQLKLVAGIKKFLPVEYRLKLINDKKVSFYFSSSKQKNMALIYYLNKQKVTYTLTRQSSLKESSDVFNEYA
jgi:putative Mg2+ transporter-C (MgtC) family protein